MCHRNYLDCKVEAKATEIINLYKAKVQLIHVGICKLDPLQTQWHQ